MRIACIWLIYLFLILVHLVGIGSNIVKAAPKTNINEVTSLFDEHIEGKDKLLNELKNQMDSAVSGVKSKSGFEMIEGMSGAENKANELKAINARDLDNEGRRKRASDEYSFYDENELEPDYTKSGNNMHKQDSDDIASATGDVLGNVIAKLNDINIDCRSVKGQVQKEPVYYIDVRRENQNNTQYDQFFCEELRNKYRCRDTLTTRCNRRETRWHNWQEEQRREISGDEIKIHYGHWFESKFKGKSKTTRRKRGRRHKFHLAHLKTDEGTKNSIKQYIASSLGVGADHVSVRILGGEGQEVSWKPQYKHLKYYMHERYVVYYRLRESYEICTEWKEEWNERCSLQ